MSCGATIRSLTWQPATGWVREAAGEPADGSPGFSSMGEDEAGELYVTALNSGGVYWLVQAAPGRHGRESVQPRRGMPPSCQGLEIGSS